mgnify:CR=1 FL=1
MIMTVTTPQLELWRIEGEFANVPHAHENECQITVPIHGTCRFTLENKKYDLSGGLGLVQHPRDRHHFEIGSESGVLIFKVKMDSLQDMARAGQIELAVRQQFDPSRLSERFRGWTNALLDGGRTDRLAQDEMESQVLDYLFGVLSGNHKTRAIPGTPRSSRGTDRYMDGVLEYIHSRYTEAIEIDELASIALQSRYHFIRSFKAAVGLTPYQYVLWLRMEEAKRKLGGSGLTVTDISYSLGFSSVSQFYRAFAKAVGMTPEKYRDACR